MSLSSISKRIDYKSSASAPSLEVPPDLTTPQYDDRYAVTTASGLAAQTAARPKQSDLLPTNPEARIAREGNERWLVVKATPEQAWSTVRKFWTDTGFVIATEQPAVGVMETDWAENRAEVPQGSVPQVRRQIHRRVLFDVQARQVPHAHRARHRSRHRGNLRIAPGHGADADGEDRQLCGVPALRGR